LHTLFLESEAQINKNNYAMMLFMSKQVSLPKISLILQKIKISPKCHIRPFCTKPFNSKLFIKCNPEAFEVIAQLAVRAIKSNIQILALFHQPSPDVSEVLTCIYTHLPCWFFPFSCMETKFLHICLKTNVENTYSLSHLKIQI